MAGAAETQGLVGLEVDRHQLRVGLDQHHNFIEERTRAQTAARDFGDGQQAHAADGIVRDLELATEGWRLVRPGHEGGDGDHRSTPG